MIREPPLLTQGKIEEFLGVSMRFLNLRPVLIALAPSRK
jgi:hypothetical protein